METAKQTLFIQQFPFERDIREDARALETAKVGDVHISRIEIKPQAIIGNLYYNTTDVIFFLESGSLRMKFFQIHTHEEKEVIYNPGDGIIHLPAQVAFAFSNIYDVSAVLIMFSNKSLQSDDDTSFPLYTTGI